MWWNILQSLVVDSILVSAKSMDLYAIHMLIIALSPW